jgi:hypothetical protein
VSVYLAAGLFACAAAVSTVGAVEYEVDLKGTIEIASKSNPAKTTRIKSENDVTYKVVFEYQEPGSTGGSFLDREAVVDSDGWFEVEKLRGNKVYRITVTREDFLSDGRVITQVVPFQIPPDLFEEIALPAGEEIAGRSVQVELPLTEPGAGTPQGDQVLCFQYNGKSVQMATVTLAPAT